MYSYLCIHVISECVSIVVSQVCFQKQHIYTCVYVNSIFVTNSITLHEPVYVHVNSALSGLFSKAAYLRVCTCQLYICHELYHLTRTCICSCQLWSLHVPTSPSIYLHVCICQLYICHELYPDKPFHISMYVCVYT